VAGRSAADLLRLTAAVFSVGAGAIHLLEAPAHYRQAALGACRKPTAGQAVGPGAAVVSEREDQRRRPGAAVREVALAAAPASIDLGGRTVSTWAYDGILPGPLLQLRAGEVLRVRLDNRLPAPTSIHWHGIALRNDMDGVPGVTQEPVAPGTSFTYEFAVPDPGSYFFHPHVGVQLDRGLYGTLVVEDPEDPGRYDRELVVVLDDWTDGVGRSPDQILQDLQRRGMAGMGGMEGTDHGGMGGMTESRGPLRGDPGDVRYPLYLVNGRPPASPRTLTARPGERVRLRIVNAAADTAFRVALGGHRLTVTHTDGFPVLPVAADALLLGMGERYDAIVELGDGVFPLVALAEGKGGRAAAVIRAGRDPSPRLDAGPAELEGRLLTAAGLRPVAGVDLGDRPPARIHRLVLAGDMQRYRWTINGRTFDQAVPLDVRQGERARLVFQNRSMMFHPMHLHGHTVQVRDGARPGPRKDTVLVRPMQRVTVDLEADNPGQWVVHCHNVYHQEAGMMTTLSYVG
jgi:FtsP/CotA-like multicopper oxidase with cupredoxin domain